MAYTNKVEAGATGQEKATREPNLWARSFYSQWINPSTIRRRTCS